MSSVSSTSSSSGGTTFGTNQSTVSFPGIVSGIDYDSIVNELTAASETQIETQQTTINQRFVGFGASVNDLALGSLDFPSV